MRQTSLMHTPLLQWQWSIFDEETIEDITKLAKPYSEMHKAEPGVYKEAVQLVALDAIVNWPTFTLRH